MVVRLGQREDQRRQLLGYRLHVGLGIDMQHPPHARDLGRGLRHPPTALAGHEEVDFGAELARRRHRVQRRLIEGLFVVLGEDKSRLTEHSGSVFSARVR